VRVETSPKRVRAYLGGHLVLDTTAPLLVWERPYYPTYYVPRADVVAELRPARAAGPSPGGGGAELFDVKAGPNTADGAACVFPHSEIEALRDAVRIEWSAMDEWLEEDEPVYTHPRDPHTRVDILASSRHVRAEVDGVTIAESSQPRILYETGLPPRYYLPMSHYRLQLLKPSERRTHCPYKGTAEYFHLELGGRREEDFVWVYRAPLPESQKIAGLAAFYNEKVDLYLDGRLQPRPRTHFG